MLWHDVVFRRIFIRVAVRSLLEILAMAIGIFAVIGLVYYITIHDGLFYLLLAVLFLTVFFVVVYDKAKEQWSKHMEDTTP